MLSLAIYTTFKYHKSQIKTWPTDAHLQPAILYGLLAFVKTIIAMFLIIFIHNSFNDSELLELLLFLVVFAAFSLLQSIYSLGGFLSRNKLLYYQTRQFFASGSKKISKMMEHFNDAYIEQSTIVMQILVTALFIIIFIPNISILITTNLIFVIALVLLLGLSLALNHIIYFGFISLMIFQFQPVGITFSNINPILFTLSFIVLFMGMSIDRRLQHKMFFLITVMQVKKFNFKLGYELVHQDKRVTIYQNMINHYYYVYYQTIGLVVVYHSEIDVKVSSLVTKKMIQYGKRYLLSHHEI
jgi:hypothetical protein